MNFRNIIRFSDIFWRKIFEGSSIMEKDLPKNNNCKRNLHQIHLRLAALLLFLDYCLDKRLTFFQCLGSEEFLD
jgi:hypothetical protein